MVNESLLDIGKRQWHDRIKRNAKDRGVRVEDLLALTSGYDPFYQGTKTDHIKAKWARDLYDWVMERWEDRKERLANMGIYVGGRPHPRAIHYLLVTGREDPRDYRGQPYEGGKKQWEMLQECFKKAKLLGYIPFGAIEDHKHPNVIRNLEREGDELVNLPDDGVASETMTYDDIEVSFDMSSLREQLEIEYESMLEEARYDLQSRIPVHVEIWTEKQRELVDAVAGEYWVNVQNAVGQQTYENVYSLLKRAVEQSDGRPVRILYLSDFDPRGEMTMPVGVSRIVEWMLYNLDEFRGLDVKLKKIILTEEQIRKYDLPPAPVKQTESMSERWKEQVGQHVCEIDSIETLFAEEMVEILRGELSQYIPDEVKDYIKRYNRKLDRALWHYRQALHHEIKEAVETAMRDLEERIHPVMKDFSMDVEVDMEDEIEKVRDVIDGFEEPDWPVNDGDDNWMFDSERGYTDQLQIYKEIRGY